MSSISTYFFTFSNSNSFTNSNSSTNSNSFSFWAILLTDAIPLLETDDLVFSANDTYELLAAIEEHGEDPKFEDKVDIFRLAAARNLSRALIIEASQPD